VSRLAIAATDRPELSVVMVTYNAWDWTRRALEALVEHTDADLELIVADNASSDGTLEGLAAVEGITVLRNPANLGFGPAANQAALRARAPLLLLLNTDALVHPGWLPPLRAVLEAEPDVAAVAPRLLHLDGSLQEVGSILWGDAEVWPYGATRAAAAPEYRFRRDVDYASAACLLLRRSAFVDSGGFDPVFAPAYYEDVDLSLRLWERGLRTVCQPRSEVTHAGGASTDRGRRTRLLEHNRPVFVERWRRLLALRPPSPVHRAPEDVIPGRDLRCDDRVLVVGDFVPDARQPQLEALLRTLVRLWPRARVTYLALDGDDAEGSAPPLLAAGVELAWPGDALEGWLRQRRHHYGVVMATSWAASSHPVRGLLESSQPHAHRVLLVDRGAARDLAGEDYAAAVRSARLLLCTGDEARAAAVRVAPSGEVVVLDGERSLAGALAPLGMAPVAR
jgi:GT2 family glycosyltransferase